MKVLKFGGTSIGNVKRLKNLSSIVNNQEKKIVVLSAMAGTTDSLVMISKSLQDDKKKLSKILINKLEKKYKKHISEIFTKEEYKTKSNKLINTHFDYIKGFTQKSFTKYQEKTILAQGELLSTALFYYYLLEQNHKPVLLSALNFMRIDKDGNPDEYYIKENLEREIKINETSNIYITQGFICRNAFGEIDNLKRGGSDYTASLIGAAINSEEVEIWSDIDGFRNNDPRFVNKTKVIEQLSFNEAAELAYFGAKILHPASILPCKNKNIVVRLKNTLNPADKGTIISSANTDNKEIKAIAAKDNITTINIKSERMLLAHGFVKKVFEIFELYKTAVDVITTSEVALSISIDNSDKLNEIIKDLEKFSSVSITNNQTIICIVGNLIAEKKGVVNNIFNALDDIPIRMISYGSSMYNITLLVFTKYKKNALELLNSKLLNNE